MPSAVSAKRNADAISDGSPDLSSPPGSPDQDPSKRVRRLERRNGNANGHANGHRRMNGGSPDDEDEDEGVQVDGEEEEEEAEAEAESEEGNILPAAADSDFEEEELLGEDEVVIEPNTQSYQPGSIRHIRVENFVTYSAVSIEPGPNLNMVIGPNGTGKSTIVCAICLGLGWSPSHLGRAKDVGEYVKHGSAEATIEIELQGRKGERNPVFKRIIRKKDNSSSWWINGKATTMIKAGKVAKSYNIQIDNLCQFLPQDRVVEFANLSSIDRLKETQRAAAHPNMLKRHEGLKNFGKELNSVQDELQTDLSQMESLDARQRMLQQDVERLREREQIIKEIELLEKAKPFIRYSKARGLSNECKAKVKSLQEDLTQLEKEIRPAMERPTRKKEYSDVLENAVGTKRSAYNRKEEEVKKQLKEIAKLEELRKSLENEIESEWKAERTRKEELRELKEKFESAKKKVENNRGPDTDLSSFNADMAEVSKKMRELRSKNDDVRADVPNLKARGDAVTDEINRANQRMSALASTAGQRERVLEKMSPETLRAWKFYLEHKDQFEMEICPPAILSCSVTDQKYADVAGSFLSKGELSAFVCQTKHDYDLLQAHCFGSPRLGIEGMKLADVTIKQYSRTLQDQPTGPWSPQKLRENGFDGYMIDFITGPEPILNMLCHEQAIHMAAVSLGEFSSAQNQRLEQIGLKLWVDRSAKYTVRSRYGASSTAVVRVRRSDIFRTQQVDQSAKSELQRQINELMDDREQIKRVLDERAAEEQKLAQEHTNALAQKKQIEARKLAQQNKINSWNKLKSNIVTMETDLKNKAEGGKGFKELIGKLDRKLDDCTTRRAEAAIEYADMVTRLVQMHHEHVKLQLRLIEAKSDVATLEARNRRTLKRRDALKEELQVAREAHETARVKAKKYQEEVIKLRQNFSPEEVEFLSSPESLERTVEGLDDEIEQLGARLGLIHNSNPNAIRQYEKRAQEMAKLRSKIEKAETRVEQLRVGIAELRNLWEPELDKLVGRISSAFSKSFAKIQCAGAVSVHKEEDDYAKWAIEIRVKFRQEEKLQLLDSHRQSGGERAVSTVFYLMALQSMARSPFRVVDEINQGMDPRNERMVHHRMVNIACQEHTSQYFLITPKLLSELMYHPRMKVHCIYSGDWIEPNNVMDYKKYFEAGRRLRGEGRI